jgi:hypothetical protein
LVERRAQGEFNRGVFATYPRHNVASL